MIDESEHPLDLSALDPTADESRFDDLVRSIMARAEDNLALRRGRSSVIGEITRWSKPILAAAAAAAAVLVLSLVRTPELPADDAETGVAEAIGIPDRLATWVRGDTRPTTVELYSFVDGQ